MLFWPFVVLGSVVLTVLLAQTPDRLAESHGAEGLRSLFVVGLISLLFLSGVGRMLRRGGLTNGLAWFGITTSVAGWLVFHEETRTVMHVLQGELTPSLALSRAPGEVELRRAWDGHFRADARINGHEIRMMVDTGASMVLIPFEKAAAIGIDPELLSFSLPVSTANGPSTVAPVRLTTVQVGPIVLRDIEAAVAHPGKLESPLLGMSFIEGLTETTFRGDLLILRDGMASDTTEQRSWVLSGHDGGGGPAHGRLGD